MANAPSQSPFRRYGLIFILALFAILVVAVGAFTISKQDSRSEPGIDRSAHDSAAVSEGGLDAVTKNNVEDTSMTVN